MKHLKLFVYEWDRSENGMVYPLLRRFPYQDPQRHVLISLATGWKRADAVLIPGDRREAMRFALDVFERGVPILHLGPDSVAPEAFHAHYDHTYRLLLSSIAHTWFPVACYPTMIDDMLLGVPDGPLLPAAHYYLLAHNACPWHWEPLPDVPADRPVYFQHPGNDGDVQRVILEGRARGWKKLAPMPRHEYLRVMKHADAVWGNSSALCYEAPVFHPDERIHLTGRRNAGRRIVRWPKDGPRPSDLLVEAIARVMGIYERVANTVVPAGARTCGGMGGAGGAAERRLANGPRADLFAARVAEEHGRSTVRGVQRTLG